MTMDFTLSQYKQLLSAIIEKDYQFQTFADFIKKPQPQSIILRHDVDLKPQNSLVFAKIQHQHQIKGVYYFRAVKESWDERIICEIAEMGHEIGYHYENLTTCRGNKQKGIVDFERNLNLLRTLAPVSTICMHGSPLSKYDSKDLWKTYSYQDFGLIGEPYFDIDFNQVQYLTDTGRRWNGEQVSVRDKVISITASSFESTPEIIQAALKNQLSDQIMFTFHPQRWNDKSLLWIEELVLQNVKNVIKKYFFVKSAR